MDTKLAPTIVRLCKAEHSQAERTVNGYKRGAFMHHVVDYCSIRGLAVTFGQWRPNLQVSLLDGLILSRQRCSLRAVHSLK
jgi:hypothetical protein